MIQQERIRDAKGLVIEDRYGQCRNVIGAAEHDQIEIATSTLSFAEVCRQPEIKDGGEDKLALYFEADYILPVNLDRGVGERARFLMITISKLKPADACHLASAAVANVEEMHTYDDRLLALDGIIDKLDGTKLKICNPDVGGAPAPLLDAMKALAPTVLMLDPAAALPEVPLQIAPPAKDEKGDAGEKTDGPKVEPPPSQARDRQQEPISPPDKV